jgi:hypothetical protein
MLEEVIGGISALSFSAIFFGTMLLGLIEFVGKIYGTYSCLSRQDLTGEQRIIYLAIIWFIPLGWLIYILLGEERTRNTFSEVSFL